MRKSRQYLPDYINISWNVEDIKSRDPDNILDRRDCMEILDTLHRTHDPEIGINWNVIDEAIQQWIKENE